MPGLVPGIHALLGLKQGVDGRDKPGHDKLEFLQMGTELDSRAGGRISLVDRLVDTVEHDSGANGDHGERDAGGKKGFHGRSSEFPISGLHFRTVWN
jgi:hypothetical protein